MGPVRTLSRGRENHAMVHCQTKRLMPRPGTGLLIFSGGAIAYVERA